MNDNDNIGAEKKYPEYLMILGLLDLILAYKYRVLIAATIGSALLFGASYLLQPKYTAMAVVAYNLNDSRGGINPSEYRGSNTIGVVEYDFLIQSAQDNERERLITRLGSFEFVKKIIEDEDLLPIIYQDKWDPQKNFWKDGMDLDIREVVGDFNRSVLNIDYDARRDLIELSITLSDAELAANIVNNLTEKFNNYIRDLEVTQLNLRSNFLQNRLQEVNNAEMHRSIYRLLEAQLSIESILLAKQNYPLELLQPAIVPLYKSSPRRKLWAVGGFVGIVLFGFASILLIRGIKLLRRDLNEYSSIKKRSDTSTTDDGLDNRGEIWVDK